MFEPVKGRCNGRRHQGEPGELCRRRAGASTTHLGDGRCALHGGTLPPAVRASHRRLAVAKANQMLVAQGFEPVDNPVAEHARLAGETLAFKDRIRRLLDELGDPSFTSQTALGQEQVHALVSLYADALVQCDKVLTNVNRLDLQGRLVKVSEATALALAGTLDRVMALPAIGITAEQRRQVLAALAEELTP